MPFSRSMRALHADASRLPLVGLIVAMVLLLAWMAWFFLARMTLYETGQIVRTTREGTMVASFSLETVGRIRRGQRAFLSLQSAGQARAPLPAIVSDITEPTHEGQVWVELYPQADLAALHARQEGVAGSVTIAVAHASPATLLLRHLGSPRPTSPVSLSPRTQ